MKNKYLVLAGNNKLEKVDNTLFLFPLKGYCVGMSHEYAIQEIQKALTFMSIDFLILRS